MFGPYPAWEDLGLENGYMDPATNDLFWVYAATYDSVANQWSVTIAQRKFSDGTFVFTTNSSLDGTGAPGGAILVDALYYYVGFFIGSGDWNWYKLDRATGSLVNQTGFIFGFTASSAYLDGLGNIVHIASTNVAVIDTVTMATVGGASLPKPCGRPGGTAPFAPGMAWARFMDGTSGGFALINSTNPSAPTVTSFDLGHTFEVDWVVYNPVTSEIIYWLDPNTIRRWSTVSHTDVLSVTHTGGYGYMGPINNGLFAVGLDIYDPVTLNIVYTANGFNPLLPPTTNAGINFGHWFDGTGVIWLKANDLQVYGAIVGIIRLQCPNGTAEFGQPYDSFLVASGTLPPYFYQIISGHLPAGLSLIDTTGEISGSPNEVGSFPFTAQATDQFDNVATANCEIDVAPPTPSGVSTPCGRMVTIELTRDLDATWSDSSTFFLTHDEPLPFTVRGIVLNIEYNPD